jgi:hypothetical protein
VITYLANAEGKDDGEELNSGNTNHSPDDNVQILLYVVGELVETTLNK